MTNNENKTRALHLVGEARYQLERALDALGSAQEADLETILAADAAARAFVREHYSK